MRKFILPLLAVIVTLAIVVPILVAKNRVDGKTQEAIRQVLLEAERMPIHFLEEAIAHRKAGTYISQHESLVTEARAQIQKVFAPEKAARLNETWVGTYFSLDFANVPAVSAVTTVEDVRIRDISVEGIYADVVAIGKRNIQEKVYQDGEIRIDCFRGEVIIHATLIQEANRWLIQEYTSEPYGDPVHTLLPADSPSTAEIPRLKAWAVDWSRIQGTTEPTPIPSTEKGYAFDSRRNRILCWKENGNDAAAGGLWEYRFEDSRWSHLQPEISILKGSSNPPTAFTWSTMAYSPVNDQIFLFGLTERTVTVPLPPGGPPPPPDSEGMDQLAKIEKSIAVWVYDCRQNEWKEPLYASEIPPRSQFATVYDSLRNRVVLYGGVLEPVTTPSGYVLPEEATQDMWSFDCKGENWLELKPADPPPVLGGHSLAYDSKRDRILLFGGNPERSSVGSLFFFYDPVANQWTEETRSASPSPGFIEPLVYDERDDLLLLYQREDGLWVYDTDQNLWQHLGLSPMGSSESVALVTDTGRGGIDLFTAKIQVQGSNTEMISEVYEITLKRTISPATP